ncbi:MAG: formate dehydrogenase accessory sulfurtransferase FdhD [Nocardioides sp.]|uniref:formate dehydrogenase accessory sulfurtransferase FdhD n=1 Tax=Nocardioides sp. TaxID=35761 RepID=UPI003F106825
MVSSELPRRPGPSVRVRVEEHRGPTVHRREDRLATEEPLEIRVAAPGRPSERVWLTMRTPGHDFELAAGYLYAEGLVETDDIDRVAYCTDADLDPTEEFNVVTVTTRRPLVVPHRHQALSSGSSACGVCGKDSVQDVLDVATRPGWEGPDLTAEVVRTLPDALREHQALFSRTGGVHAAAVADASGAIGPVREDVGRHNAVDKAVGALLLTGRPVASAALVVSGRAGFELVQKAVTSGMGSLVAVGAPTSLAVQLATQAGLALWGFVSDERAVRYA